MLLLENNSFTDPLPVLDLPNLVKFNVSNNNLTGPVPDNLKKFFPDSFLGNNLCGESQLQQCSGICKKHRVGRIFGIAVGGFSLTGLILAILVILRGRSKHVRLDNNEDEKSTSNDDYSISLRETEKMKNSLVFSSVYKNPFCLEDLLRAPAEVLGEGSVGVAYRANILQLGTVVVVKRATEVVSEPTKFIQRINRIAKMTHKNLLPLKAYYCSHQEKFLVYDYMPMGSLYTILHDLANPRAIAFEEKNKRVVRRLYEALGTGDAETVQGILAPHLDWRFHGPPSCQYLMPLLTGLSTHTDFSFSPYSITALGHNLVVAEGGEDESVYWVHVWTLENASCIVTELREYFNTSVVVTEFNPPSSSSSSSTLAGQRQRERCSVPLWQSHLIKSNADSMPGLVLAV